MTEMLPQPRRTRPEPTFRGTPPFPEAAKAALANSQLRTNLGRATATIRTKRAAVVEERACQLDDLGPVIRRFDDSVV